MPRILTTKSYEHQLLKFRKKHPELREQYYKTLKILEVNPFHPSLRLHKLRGKLNEYYSVSINMQYRIMIDFVIQEDMVVLLSIGGHGELNM
jgi:mRNA-degrading endonuclease YafQ of YafQ-DinJ toxin-antitoxin module